MTIVIGVVLSVIILVGLIKSLSDLAKEAKRYRAAKRDYITPLRSARRELRLAIIRPFMQLLLLSIIFFAPFQIALVAWTLYLLDFVISV